RGVGDREEERARRQVAGLLGRAERLVQALPLAGVAACALHDRADQRAVGKRRRRQRALGGAPQRVLDPLRRGHALLPCPAAHGAGASETVTQAERPARSSTSARRAIGPCPASTSGCQTSTVWRPGDTPSKRARPRASVIASCPAPPTAISAAAAGSAPGRSR